MVNLYWTQSGAVLAVQSGVRFGLMDGAQHSVTYAQVYRRCDGGIPADSPWKAQVIDFAELTQIPATHYLVREYREID